MLSHGARPTPSDVPADGPDHEHQAPPTTGALGAIPFGRRSDGRPYRLLHVEPVPVVRAGIKAQLADLDGLELLPSSDDPTSALGLLDSLQPDLLLAEIGFEQVDGLEWLKMVCHDRRSLLVVVFTSLPASVFAARARRSGAHAFVGKEATAATLVENLVDVVNGRKRFPAAAKPYQGSLCEAVGCLSDRELAVFQLLGHGHSTKEIANLLGRSPKTVETHRVNVMRKLGVDSINALLRVAVRWLENPDGTMPLAPQPALG